MMDKIRYLSGITYVNVDGKDRTEDLLSQKFAVRVGGLDESWLNKVANVVINLTSCMYGMVRGRFSKLDVGRASVERSTVNNRVNESILLFGIAKLNSSKL
jgi:hypothetical protein